MFVREDQRLFYNKNKKERKFKMMYCCDFKMGLKNYNLAIKEIKVVENNVVMIINEDEIKIMARIYFNTDCNTEEINNMFNELYKYLIVKEEVIIGLTKAFYKIIETTICFEEIYEKLENKYEKIINNYIHNNKKLK